MCRFTFYQGKPIRLGSLITEPKHSLINQSFNSAERIEPLNGDGFGLAWYNHSLSGQPALFKSISPAWSNANLRELSRIIESNCIMAHVRAATQGFSVGESNCHPFKWRNIAFMHNGDIGDFRKIRRSLINSLSDEAYYQIKGNTDSEHFFAVFIDELIKLSESAAPEFYETAMLNAIKRVLHLVEKHTDGAYSYMNMILTDGRYAVAVRLTTDEPEQADSLYINLGRKYVCEDGICYMMDPGEVEKAVIISSEPLSTDPGWEPVPVNSMVLVNEGRILDKMAIEL